MRLVRRCFVLLLVVVAVGAGGLGVAGCGAGSHFAGGVIAHHVIDHFAHSAAAQRRVNKGFCLYHGHRVLVDVRNHHYFAAGLNAVAAYRACSHGFLKH